MVHAVPCGKCGATIYLKAEATSKKILCPKCSKEKKTQPPPPMLPPPVYTPRTRKEKK